MKVFEWFTTLLEAKAWNTFSRNRMAVSFSFLSQFFKPLPGRTRSRRKCGATVRLSHHPNPSGRAVHEEVDGLDIGGQHGWRFVFLCHTHRLQRRLCPFVQAGVEASDTDEEVVKPDLGFSWESHSRRVYGGVRWWKWKYFWPRNARKSIKDSKDSDSSLVSN